MSVPAAGDATPTPPSPAKSEGAGGSVVEGDAPAAVAKEAVELGVEAVERVGGGEKEVAAATNASSPSDEAGEGEDLYDEAI